MNVKNSRETVCYCLTFKNGKRYVGITMRGKARFADHRRNARKGVELPVYRAWRKYGEPEETVIARGTLEEMQLLEIKLINEWGLMNSENGYNASMGGETSPMLVEEVRKKFIGKKMSEEQKLKLSIAHTGKVGRLHTPESRAKMSASRKGVPKSAEQRAVMISNRIGKRHSDETKAKIGAATRARAASKTRNLNDREC